MTATRLLRHLKEPITRKIVFLVMLLFGALGLLLAQHHIAHVYTSRCQEALDNQHAKRSLGWIIRKKLVQAESALHQLAAEDDARKVRVLRKHIADRVTSIERALTVLSNGGAYEHVIRINFENTDEFRETISYAKDDSERIVIEVVELVPKLVDLECNVKDLADAVRKRIVAENDTSRETLSGQIALRRKQAEATLVRCGETSNKIHCDTSQKLAAIERRSMKLADRVRLAEYATAGILGLLCVVVAGITLRQVTGILKERRGLLGDLRKHHDHLDELVTERTAALSKTNEQLQQEVTERKQAEEAMRESERRLKALLDANPTGVVVIDAETHQIIEANPVAVRMIGASKKRILGRKCHKCICPAESGQCPISDLGQKVNNSERVLIRADGEEVPILKTVVPIVLDDRECFLESFIDIAELKRAEEALRKSQERYRDLVETIEDWIWEVDTAGVYTYVSPRVRDMLGYEPQEVLGRTPFDLMPPEEATRVAEAFRQIVATRKPFAELENRHLHKDGHLVLVETSGVPFLDKEGTLLGYRCVDRNVTERKRAEAVLEDVHHQLVQTSRRAGMAEIATGVLHNVGNVLNSVNVSASLVTDKIRKSKVPGLAKASALMREHARDLGTYIAEDEKGKKLPSYLARLAEHLADEQGSILEELESLTKNVEHIKRIVSAQQSHAGTFGVTESVSIVDVVDAAISINVPSFERHGIQLVREYTDLPPTTIDKQKLLAILVNLIQNAKHAVFDGTCENRRLTLRVGRSGDDHVRIEVIDNGVGIPSENLTRIFSHGFTTKDEGHGFGLHSAALAATEMGGGLSVRSDGPGKGATFTLEMPLEPAEVG